MFERLIKPIPRYWRSLSLLGFTLGILLPWRLVYSDVISFESNQASLLYGWWEIKDSFVSLSRGRHYAFPFQDYWLLDVAVLLGAFCLALYTLGNSYRMFFATSSKIGDRLRVFLRITSICSALILVPYLVSPMWNSETAIGYYITAITIFGSVLLEGNDGMNLNAKYPYLTAWVGIIALNALIGVFLLLVPYDIIRLFLQAIIGFFIFRFVIERNVLPYVAKDDTRIEKPEIL